MQLILILLVLLSACSSPSQRAKIEQTAACEAIAIDAISRNVRCEYALADLRAGRTTYPDCAALFARMTLPCGKVQP